jgi:hypothetical protein
MLLQVNLKRLVKQKGTNISAVKYTIAIVWQKETDSEAKEKITRDVESYYKQQFLATRGLVVREMVCAAQ